MYIKYFLAWPDWPQKVTTLQLVTCISAGLLFSLVAYMQHMTNFFSSSWTFKFYFLVTYGHRTSHKTPSIECLLKSHLYKNPHKIFTIFLDFINIKLHLYILAPTAVVSPLIWLEINVVIKKVVFILPAYMLLCV